jgi:transposase
VQTKNAEAPTFLPRLPQYVKPFVKRGKNDRNDAEAICEASSRPNMRYVPVKTRDMQAHVWIVEANPAGDRSRQW